MSSKYSSFLGLITDAMKNAADARKKMHGDTRECFSAMAALYDAMVKDGPNDEMKAVLIKEASDVRHLVDMIGTENFGLRARMAQHVLFFHNLVKAIKEIAGTTTTGTAGRKE